MTVAPPVSIGIPVYNGERYLAGCLASVAAQDFSDIEILVSDNTSTDATEDIVRMAAKEDDRIVYHRNESNIGGARNQNQLVDLARGELFKWAYYDDLLAPSLVGKCVAALEASGPDAALAYPLVQLIDETDTVVGTHDDLHLGLDAPQVHIRLYQLLRRVVGQVQFGLIRAQMLRATRRASLYIGGEHVMPAELCLRGRLIEVPERLQSIRTHEQRFGGDRASEARWIDPTGKHAELFPYSKSTRLLLRAIHEAPLSRAEKARCSAVVLRAWTLPQWRYLASDIVHLPEDLAHLRRTRSSR